MIKEQRSIKNIWNSNDGEILQINVRYNPLIKEAENTKQEKGQKNTSRHIIFKFQNTKDEDEV